MASLFPILGVLYLALYHYNADGYYGQPGYKGDIVTTHAPTTNAANETVMTEKRVVSEEKFQAFVDNPLHSDDYFLRFVRGIPELDDRGLMLTHSLLILEKVEAERPALAFVQPAVYVSQRVVGPLRILCYLDQRQTTCIDRFPAAV